MPDIRSYLREQLQNIEHTMSEAETKGQDILKPIHHSQYRSAVNLLHYLALRARDCTQLQQALHLHGLSGFYGSEGYIKKQVSAILQHFGEENADSECDYNESKNLLRKKASALFGEPDAGLPSLMVTFKTSFSHDFITVKKLLKAGMNIARINCAHDDEAAWLKMIERVREASQFTGIPCKICMDLAGPKIRTVINKKNGRIELEEDDLFILTEKPNVKTRLPVVRYSIPGIANQLKNGERVFFDDGLIEAKVTSTGDRMAELEVIRIASKKPFLKNGKGINFPDSRLSLSALTEFDHKCLPFVTRHADMVAYSFVHNIPDLLTLHDAMKDHKIPVILKIETAEAFNNLPGLLLTAMKEENCGVMIARGDLAVEIGFERLGEAQEEITALCRAAHIPVIFATQVLENFNKTGMATRAEITDASFGLAADCILLNKGPRMVQTIKILKNIVAMNIPKNNLFHGLSKWLPAFFAVMGYDPVPPSS